jgi:hypothetical protein
VLFRLGQLALAGHAHVPGLGFTSRAFFYFFSSFGCFVFGPWRLLGLFVFLVYCSLLLIDFSISDF